MEEIGFNYLDKVILYLREVGKNIFNFFVLVSGGRLDYRG